MFLDDDGGEPGGRKWCLAQLAKREDQEGISSESA